MWQLAQVTLRPQTEDDLPFIEELVIAVRETEFGFRHLLPEERVSLLKGQNQLQLAHYQRVFPQAHFLIIVADSKPIGRLYLDHRPDHMRVVELSLLPPYQGQGIGHRFLSTLQTEAARTQIPIRLSVALDNPAIAFYQKLGFRETGRSDTHYNLIWEPIVNS